MGIQINTNVQSLIAQRNLSKVKLEQDSALEKLSSGSRINKASDDSAGLAISEKLRADIRSSKQAGRNAGDGIAMVQTAEGGLNEISNILIRLRELSVQASSDTIGDTERGFTDMEFQNLSEEVNRIATSTKFNGQSLLSGQGDQLEFQVGIHNIDSEDRMGYNPADSDVTGDTLGLTSLSVGSQEGAQENLGVIDTAIDTINQNRSSLGALQTRLQSTINGLEITTENLSAARSRIKDTDFAKQTAELTRTNMLTNASSSVLAQANVSGQSALALLG
ncbi:MAG: flagellin FliC [Bdellovibrionales bacterium]|jgi:flagellin|nr:flagellin FliC [Bdellovibrionales bacterium]MBT3526061.1 flagellin FliC [Bdellovibrionales bacterium]MBT7669979.1 flagellin FliC [Bdellovibrionales bacterium]